MTETDDSERSDARALLDYIDASPSPWHAVDQAASMLEQGGFKRLRENEAWHLTPGGCYYVVRDDSSLIAVRLGDGDPATHGWRLVGAHTDSPGLRVKPRAAHARGAMTGLGVEVYGGPILATFADRDLTLAGRVFVRAGNTLVARRVHFKRPLLRLPNAAIHLNRSVNEDGLKFDRQEELPLLLSTLDEELPPDDQFRALLARELDEDAGAIAAWGLAVADTQPGALFGAQQEFIADSQLDNLASCHAALIALLREPPCRGGQLCALFDHEEIGSLSYKGAAGDFLEATLARIAGALGLDTDAGRRAASRSWLLSADMAHAWHPNYARFYDQQHQVLINGGPVIKINANQRYATDEMGEAYFASLCARAGVPCQRYVHRSNLPCGSTIGPILAARLGIRTIDVGNPMWSMHSLRESAGALDHGRMIRVLEAFYGDWGN